jgi:DNA-binding XRE family transcriptional regulator
MLDNQNVNDYNSIIPKLLNLSTPNFGGLMKYGEILKGVRVKKGLSQEALAEQAGVAQKSISVYESGSSLPSVKIAERIAQVLGVTLTEMMKQITEW